MFPRRAALIFASASHSMKAFRAACFAIRCFATSSLLVIPLKAGNRSLRVDGRLGFFPKTSCDGENPYTFCKAFFALIAHANATSKSVFPSNIILSNIEPMIALCRSHVPLDHGDSAAVVVTSVFMFSLISTMSELLNSPPLSVKILSGTPNVLIQCIMMLSTTVSFVLSGITTALLYLVARSIMCRRMF